MGRWASESRAPGTMRGGAWTAERSEGPHLRTEMMETLLFTDERCLLHETPYSHPESPKRLRKILDSLAAEPVPGTEQATVRPATRDELLLVHEVRHVDAILELRGRSTQLDVDTWLSPGSVDAALLAAGATVEAVRALKEGRARNAFVLVRPPGHHAESNRSMGFCIFNNVALAAAVARKQLGVERILIADWDVHHGNGTQEIFWDRSDVLFFSTHRKPPFYPQTGTLEEVGAGEGLGYTVNVPLPGGVGDGDFLSIYREILEPIADAYRPELVLVSAGFDTHVVDPLGGMEMTAAGFAALTTCLRGIAERHADGRLALVLEGGYDLGGLTEGVRACIDVLAAEELPRPSLPPPRPEVAELIRATRAFHAANWPTLQTALAESL